MFEKYVHHEAEVSVRSDLKGTHRDYCLCYSCDRLVDGTFTCPIAKKVFKTCVEYNLVTPVWECPSFKEAKPFAVNAEVIEEVESTGEAEGATVEEAKTKKKK